MDAQLEAAVRNMASWLADPHELGKMPRSIEFVGSFMLYEMKYYVFRFKPGVFGKWLVGVCGGFEEGSLEPCGHTFSEMKPYEDDEKAVYHCADMVKKVRNYIIAQGEKLGREKGI